MDGDRIHNRSEPYYHCRASELADTILVVENVEILVNRKFLASRSSYFENMLFGSFKESTETRVELKELKLSVFYDCLDLMHGIPLEYDPGNMDLKHLSELITHARLFDLPVVLKYLEWELGFPQEGCEVERYLLACHHALHEDTKKTLLKYVTKRKLRVWLKNTKNKEDITELKKSDMARIISLAYVNEEDEGDGEREDESSSDDTENCETLEEDKIETKITDGSYTYYDADVQLEVEGTTIGVNRNNLSYISQFFYKLFIKNSENVVHLLDVKLDVLIDCLDIVHDQGIIGAISIRRLYLLLDLSTRLQLQSVGLFCIMEMHRLLAGCSDPDYNGDIPIQISLLARQFRCNQVLKDLRLLNLGRFQFRRFYERLNILALNIDIEAVSDMLSEIAETTLPGWIVRRSTRMTVNEADWRSFSTKSEELNASLIAENTTFYVNKWVVASHSSYFKQLLLEKGEEEVVLEDVNPAVFLICLNIIHGNIPENLVKVDCHLVEMMQYAHKFKMPAVKTFCELESSTNSEQEIAMFFHSLRCDTESIQMCFSRLTKGKIIAWLKRHVKNDASRLSCKLSIPIEIWIQLIEAVVEELRGPWGSRVFSHSNGDDVYQSSLPPPLPVRRAREAGVTTPTRVEKAPECRQQ